MRRLSKMIGELIEGDPRILIGLGVVLVIVVALVIYARATRARRMRAQGRVLRRRD